MSESLYRQLARAADWLGSRALAVSEWASLHAREVDRVAELERRVASLETHNRAPAPADGWAHCSCRACCGQAELDPNGAPLGGERRCQSCAERGCPS